jgi:hypothetical protein
MDDHTLLYIDTGAILGYFVAQLLWVWSRGRG